MPIIRPISDLRNNFNKISEEYNKNTEPTFITINGHGDLVVISIDSYENLKDAVMKKINHLKLQ